MVKPGQNILRESLRWANFGVLLPSHILQQQRPQEHMGGWMTWRGLHTWQWSRFIASGVGLASGRVAKEEVECGSLVAQKSFCAKTKSQYLLRSLWFPQSMVISSKGRHFKNVISWFSVFLLVSSVFFQIAIIIKMIICNYFYRELIFWRLLLQLQLQLHFSSLAELILAKCNSSWGNLLITNYVLQELHLQLHFLSVGNLNCNHFGADSNV